jgi:(2Fe-2S) ferredoxin
MVCRGPECGDKRGSAQVHAALQRELARPLDGNEVKLELYSCFGKCQKGVNVLVREVKPGENTRLLLLMPTASSSAFLYHAVKPEEAPRIVEEHVLGGAPILDFTRRK